MEHVEYLKKVAMAKKHEKEYRETGVKFYYWVFLLGALGVITVPDTPYLLFSLVICLLGGLICVYKTEKNKNEFSKKFPEEDRIMNEHEELLK